MITPLTEIEFMGEHCQVNGGGDIFIFIEETVLL